MATELTTDELLTVPEVAQRLRVNKETVRRWIVAGVMEAITLPNGGVWHQYRVKQSELNRIIGQEEGDVDG